MSVENEAQLVFEQKNSKMRPIEWHKTLGFIRQHLIACSFAAFVLLPTLAGMIYYTFIAQDRYVSGAGFAIRGMDAGNGMDIFGAFTGFVSSGSTTSDSYILLKFLKSRDLVERLEAKFPLRSSYSAPNGDFLSRLDKNTEIENVVDYWQQHIQTTFDSTSGIITFEVDTFSPITARDIASLILFYSKILVNDLSESARQDAVSYAESEVARAETRLKNALEQLRLFRSEEQSLDPSRVAQLQIEIVGSLEKQLAEVRARISALAPSVSADSPPLRVLQRQAEALEKQIVELNAEMSKGRKGDTATLTGLLATYETLEVERNFAQQSYVSALASLEKARVDANRQQRYLAIYSTPALPEYALYPHRLLNIFIIFASLTLIWAIALLIGYSIRDHMA